MGEKDAVYSKHIGRSSIINGVTLDRVVDDDWYIDMAVIDERNAVAFLLCQSNRCGEGKQDGDNSLLLGHINSICFGGLLFNNGAQIYAKKLIRPKEMGENCRFHSNRHQPGKGFFPRK